MLPLSNDHLRIAISPRQIAITWVKGWFKKSILEKKVIAFDRDYNWMQVVQALDHAFDCGSAWAEVERVHLILPSHWLRYQVLSWNNDLMESPDACAAYAKLLFQRVYGDVSQSWTVRVADADFGQSRLAVAMDVDLANQLRERFKSRHKKLLSITPDLISAFNGQVQYIQNDHNWLILLQEDLLVLSMFNNKQWQQVSTWRCQAKVETALVQFIEQSLLIQNAETSPERIYLYAPLLPLLIAPPEISKPIVYLKCAPKHDFSPNYDAAVAFALLEG